MVIYPIEEIGGSDSSWIRYMMSKSSDYREKQCLDQLERMGIHFSSSSSQEDFRVTNNDAPSLSRNNRNKILLVIVIMNLLVFKETTKKN